MTPALRVVAPEAERSLGAGTGRRQLRTGERVRRVRSSMPTVGTVVRVDGSGAVWVQWDGHDSYQSFVAGDLARVAPPGPPAAGYAAPRAAAVDTKDGTNQGDDGVVGRCQHCGVAQFDNPDADPALDAMAHLCWKCVRPHGVAPRG